MFSNNLLLLTKVTKACVLLISIKGENTAVGNGIPGNIEDMIVF